MVEVTQKLLNHLSEKKRNQKKLVSSIQELADYLGISHQLVYNRFDEHKWSDTDVLALSQLFEINPRCTGISLTLKVKSYLKEKKIEKRESYWTRADAASFLEISISLLYQRMKKHNWKEREIFKINTL